MSSEWATAGISRPDPPAFDIPGEIYNEHMGLLPGCLSHVPGAMFRLVFFYNFNVIHDVAQGSQPIGGFQCLTVG